MGFANTFKNFSVERYIFLIVVLVSLKFQMFKKQEAFMINVAVIGLGVGEQHAAFTVVTDTVTRAF